MNTTFLTRDDVAAVTPSAIATSHDGRRSDRYRFVPTVEIIDSMEANGVPLSRGLAFRVSLACTNLSFKIATP